MNRTLKTLTGFLAATVAILAALPMTGCNTLQKAQDEHPVIYNFAKGAAEIALVSYLSQSDESFVADNRTALLHATNAVFARNDDPRDVAVDMATEIEGLFPDDPATREAIMRNLSNVLRPDPNTPASGPETKYKSALADELESMLPPTPESAAALPPKRQDLVGHLFGLREKPAPYQARVDLKWHEGLRHMVENPQ